MGRGGRVALGVLGAYLAAPVAYFLADRVRGTLTKGYSLFGETDGQLGTPPRLFKLRGSIVEEFRSFPPTRTPLNWVLWPAGFFVFSK